MSINEPSRDGQPALVLASGQIMDTQTGVGVMEAIRVAAAAAMTSSFVYFVASYSVESVLEATATAVSGSVGALVPPALGACCSPP